MGYFEVNVSRRGIVFFGENRAKALRVYRKCVERSLQLSGRKSPRMLGVALFRNGEVWKEHDPYLAKRLVQVN